VWDDGSTLTERDGQFTATSSQEDRGPAGVQHGFYVNGNYQGPPVVFTGDQAADAARAKTDAERWATERRGRGINTVGPEGSEQRGFYEFLGRASAAGRDNAQYFAAVHDVQGAQAHVQAMYQGRLAEYNRALADSAIRGYTATGRSGSGRIGAELAREIWAQYGFNVSGPADVNVGPVPRPAPWARSRLEPRASP
jgi:hypothetical protein